MSYQFIEYEKQDAVAHIALNRPQKLNALNQGLLEEFSDAVHTAETDRSVRVLVIKANGRAFSAGYDVSPPENGSEERDYDNIRVDIERLRGNVNKWNTLWNLSKPVIAQVHGYCVAGGTDLALHCDIIVAAEDAIFGFPAVRSMGTPPTHMWTYMVGPQWAKYTLLTGNSIDGKTAERIGLVWKAVPRRRPGSGGGGAYRDDVQDPMGAPRRQQSYLQQGPGADGKDPPSADRRRGGCHRAPGPYREGVRRHGRSQGVKSCPGLAGCPIQRLSRPEEIAQTSLSQKHGCPGHNRPLSDAFVAGRTHSYLRKSEVRW